MRGTISGQIEAINGPRIRLESRDSLTFEHLKRHLDLQLCSRRQSISRPPEALHAHQTRHDFPQTKLCSSVYVGGRLPLDVGRPGHRPDRQGPGWEGLRLVGLETGSLSPFLYRGLADLGFPVVGIDARHAADTVLSRRVKSDHAAKQPLAEMLRSGWFSAVEFCPLGAVCAAL